MFTHAEWETLLSILTDTQDSGEFYGDQMQYYKRLNKIITRLQYLRLMP